MKEVLFYETIDGKIPCYEWLNSLDGMIKQRVRARIIRLRDGNYGDFKKIGKDITELRCKFGAGYRIYCTEKKNTVIILINGGDKSTQKKDIEKAKKFLKDINERY